METHSGVHVIRLKKQFGAGPWIQCSSIDFILYPTPYTHTPHTGPTLGLSLPRLSTSSKSANASSSLIPVSDSTRSMLLASVFKQLASRLNDAMVPWEAQLIDPWTQPPLGVSR